MLVCTVTETVPRDYTRFVLGVHDFVLGTSNFKQCTKKELRSIDRSLMISLNAKTVATHFPLLLRCNSFDSDVGEIR